jgi:hypothetical protein
MKNSKPDGEMFGYVEPTNDDNDYDDDDDDE